MPWLKEDFNYQIRGGLEPGEEASWNLAPNSFSAWGTVKPPEDVGLQVTVERLDGSNGQELFSTNKFTDRDASRLATLQKEYEK